MYGVGERKTHGTGESLDSIVARSRLPIAVTYIFAVDCWLIGTPALARFGKKPKYSAEIDLGKATRAYLRIVDTFTESKSAATPADDAPSRRVCGAVSPGGAAINSPAPQ